MSLSPYSDQPSIWQGLQSYFTGSKSPASPNKSASRTVDDRMSKYGKAPTMPLNKSSSMSSSSSMSTMKPSSSSRRSRGSSRMSSSLDMKLKEDLKSLEPGYVIDITGISDTNQYKIVKAPTMEDAHVIFYHHKMMSLNEKDARYAGYALLNDNLVSEFLSAEDAKLSASKSPSMMKSKSMKVRAGHALDVDTFDSTKKATLVKIPEDLESSNMVLFYDGKLLAADDAEDDVQAYASYIANGDQQMENSILSSYYDESAKKMLGASRVAGSPIRSRSPYSMRSRSRSIRPSSRFTSEYDSDQCHLEHSPAVDDVAAYMAGSAGSSRSRSPITSQRLDSSKFKSRSRSRYSPEPSFDDEVFSFSPEPSFDDEMPARMQSKSQASSRMQTRSQAKMSQASQSRMQSAAQSTAQSRMQTRLLTERQPPSRYQPSMGSSKQYVPPYAQDVKQSALKPSSVRYSSKSSSPKFESGSD